MSAKLDLDALGLLGWVSTEAIARGVLGKPKSRAANDWCRRHGIPLRRDGKFLFASIDSVRKAIEGCPVAGENDTDAPDADVALLIAGSKGRRR